VQSESGAEPQRWVVGRDRGGDVFSVHGRQSRLTTGRLSTQTDAAWSRDCRYPVPCIACRPRGGVDWTRAPASSPAPDEAVAQCVEPALLHLFARRAKRKCGAAGSEPVNASGSDAAAGAPDTGPALSLRAESGRGA
jgi:hypothetical protein